MPVIHEPMIMILNTAIVVVDRLTEKNSFYNDELTLKETQNLHYFS
jgi:hypothetical protein